MLNKFLIIMAFLFSKDLIASDAKATKTEMNGIKMSDFDGFESKWKLVTVRYRKDTQEMRWTFANDLAWSTLSSGKTTYKQGAAFAKIGIMTSEDSQFPSSIVPLGARRYQFMVRDNKKYSNTDGWGYALFDPDGKIFPDDMNEATQACFACHKIVTNRGQVFSQPLVISPFINVSFFSHGNGAKEILFSDMETSKLPESVKKFIPISYNKIRQVKNVDIINNIFQGTLDEIKPNLELEARRSKGPAILISLDRKRFSLIIPYSKLGCKPDRFFKSIMTTKDANNPVIEKEYCNP